MAYIPDCYCVVDGSPHAAHMEAAQWAHFLEDKKCRQGYMYRNLITIRDRQYIVSETGVADTHSFNPDPDPAN
jgi:hypothetical protein